ncbi:MAG: thioredoxin family protein [Opitutales bacterium]
MKFRTFLSASLFAALALPLSAAVETGSMAPDFTLTDTSGTEHSLSDFKGKYVVLEWVNHNCPFVQKHYNSGNMQALQKEFTDQGVVWLAINSTNPDHRDYKTPAEADMLTRQHGAEHTALLMDPTGKVGKLYDAKTTPHMYVINPEGKLIYQGAIDSIQSANPKDIAKADNYVKTTLMAAMSGEGVDMASTRPYGCSVKY